MNMCCLLVFFTIQKVQALDRCSASLFTYRFGGVNLSFTDCVMVVCYLCSYYFSCFKMNFGAKAADVKLRQLL